MPEYTPRKKTKTSAPWWSRELTKEVKRKYKAWKQYSETLSSEDYKNYVKKINLTRYISRKAKCNYEEALVAKVKSERKQLFKYIRSEQKAKSTVS